METEKKTADSTTFLKCVVWALAVAVVTAAIGSLFMPGKTSEKPTVWTPIVSTIIAPDGSVSIVGSDSRVTVLVGRSDRDAAELSTACKTVIAILGTRGNVSITVYEPGPDGRPNVRHYNTYDAAPAERVKAHVEDLLRHGAFDRPK